MTNFLNFLVQGVAQGAIYALIALGFVIIFKATHVLNFAHGGLMILGGYFTYQFAASPSKTLWLVDLQLAERFGTTGWIVAVLMALVVTALCGLMVEVLVLRRMRGRPVFALVMATLGVQIIIDQVVNAVWSSDPLSTLDPLGTKSWTPWGVLITLPDVVTVIVALVVTTGFLIFFNRSKTGTAMRATAIDQEAAIAQGISPKRIFGLSWMIAGALAALAGVLLSSGNGRTLNYSTLGLAAFPAFPAIILGGLDSTTGAIVGGMVIGIAQKLMQGYQIDVETYVGPSFSLVFPYLIMIGILLVKPYGFFGTKEVRRV